MEILISLIWRYCIPMTYAENCLLASSLGVLVGIVMNGFAEQNATHGKENAGNFKI